MCASVAGTAAAEAPPVVTLLSPADHAIVTSTPVSVTIKVRSGAPILGVQASVEGGQERGVLRVKPQPEGGAAGTTYVLSVPIPPRDCTLKIQAQSAPSSSAPVLLHLRWQESADPGVDRALLPSLHVLAIGVSAYQKVEIGLRFAAKDARDLAAVFAAQPRSFYRAVTVKLLVDQEATRDRILDALEDLRKRTTAKDVAVLFLAGHGITDPSTGSYYFLPHDADPEAIMRTMIPEAQIVLTLRSIPGKRILFLDTCHAGKVFSEDPRGVEDIAGFVKELASAENGTVVFTASTKGQASVEAAAWQNGAFTKAVVEGLKGKADLSQTGKISVSMLEHYVFERVKELTRGRQTPTTAKPSTMPDFPLVVRREVSDEDIDPIR